jgi:hypothetical protein
MGIGFDASALIRFGRACESHQALSQWPACGHNVCTSKACRQQILIHQAFLASFSLMALMWFLIVLLMSVLFFTHHRLNQFTSDVEIFEISIARFFILTPPGRRDDRCIPGLSFFFVAYACLVEE